MPLLVDGFIYYNVSMYTKFHKNPLKCHVDCPI